MLLQQENILNTRHFGLAKTGKLRGTRTKVDPLLGQYKKCEQCDFKFILVYCEQGLVQFLCIFDE